VLGALLLLAVTTGCYRYTPIDPAAVRANEEVRVRVTESAATRLVRDFGVYTAQLDGQFALEGTDSASVAVAIGRMYQGMALENARQTLFLGRSEIVDVRRRELSRSRTALATLGALAGFVALVQTVSQLGDENPPEDGPPPPPPARRLYFTIPIR
jgi:hypothetical protein